MSEQTPLTGAVFISYCSQDAPAAERICETLRAAGVEVWLDKNELRGGDAWDAQIKKRIHECALFIPLISAHTNARSEGYFRGEWKLATRRLLNMADDSAFLVPVVIDETREADARVPEEFLSAQWTWLLGGETPPAFAERVRQLLGEESTSDDAGKSAPTNSNAQVGHARRRRKVSIQTVIPAVVVLLVIGAGAIWYYQSARDKPGAEPGAASASSAAAVAPHDKSIAVLPFVNMSPDKDQEYFADGIAEELLNLLAQVPDLRVIARTSSFAFKGEKIEIAEIAKKLNVAHVVEGSIRKSGNKLRITTQLVRTADSVRLWSETYDRSLDDIFSVQDEIARAIVQALQIKLMGGALSRREGGTQNLEAYQLYLRAESAKYQSTQASLDAAEEHLEMAIRLDPSYGSAWVELANVFVNKADSGFMPMAEGYERARQATQRALQLSPELASARAVLQYVHQAFDWDWAAAEAEGRRTRAAAPSDPDALNVAGMLSYALGRWNDAERQFRASLDRDPLNTYVIWNLGFTYYGAGRFAESEAAYRRLLEMEPGFVWGHNYLGMTLLAQGKAEEALAIVQQQADAGERLKLLPVVLYANGRKVESDAALRAQMERWAEAGAFYIAMSHAYRGDHDRAMEWLERAYEQRDTWLTTILGVHLFKSMVDDPRYKALLRKLKLPE